MRQSRGAGVEAAKKLVRGMDYPLDAVFDMPSIRVSGTTGAVAENCRGILFYSSERLVLDMGDYTATIDGSGLTMRELSTAQLSVDGSIQIICIEDGGRADG